MHYIITFESGKFNLENERENPINPVHGISMAEWLSPLLVQRGIEVSEIDAEDWGWYLYATLNGREYLVGFVALPDRNGIEEPELIIQIDKKRSFMEVISLKNKMNGSDELLQIVKTLVSDIEDSKLVKVIKVA